MLPPGQGRHQHDQRALRQVKVGDQRIHTLEGIAGVDKDVGPAGSSGQTAVLPGKALQRAAGGGAHGDDPAALFLGLADDAGGLLRDDAKLRMHLMVLDLLRLHRAEGAQAHMQRHVAQLHALGGDLLHQFLGKMQPGGGGSGAADFPGIDGLIPLAVLQLLLDIGRQRHFAQPLQHLQEDALIIKADDAVAALRHALHGSLQFPVAEKDLRAGLGLSSGAAETFPAALPQIPQQHQLHAAAGGPGADQPGRQHPGIVKDHAVPFPQIVQQLIKMPVL